MDINLCKWTQLQYGQSLFNDNNIRFLEIKNDFQGFSEFYLTTCLKNIPPMYFVHTFVLKWSTFFILTHSISFSVSFSLYHLSHFLPHFLSLYLCSTFYPLSLSLSLSIIYALLYMLHYWQVKKHLIAEQYLIEANVFNDLLGIFSALGWTYFILLLSKYFKLLEQTI